MKKAVLFVGQGSQYTNMGLDFLDNDNAKKKLDIANEILGFNILDILKNENNELNKTKYTQTITAFITIVMYDTFLGYGNHADAFLGFSLGEYVALYAAGVYNFEEVMKIVSARAKFMEEASVLNPGKMVAVLNADLEVLKNIVDKISLNDNINIANYNAKNQVVVSGSNTAIELLILKLKEKQIKRVIPLNVSGAFHSKLMEDAGKSLRIYLNMFKPKINSMPVYMNVTAKPLNINNLNDLLEKQIKSSVYFYQSIEQMINDGITEFIEIGPGIVLSQLVRKNYPNVLVKNINKLSDLKGE